MKLFYAIRCSVVYYAQYDSLLLCFRGGFFSKFRKKRVQTPEDMKTLVEREEGNLFTSRYMTTLISHNPTVSHVAHVVIFYINFLVCPLLLNF